MCSAVTEAAEKNATTLVPRAKALSEKFYKAFNLFGDCHKIYNSSSILTSVEIQELSKSFMR